MHIEDKEFFEKLLATFKIEAEEHINAIFTGFINLERESDKEQQKSIIETTYREIHSLKGAARAVDLIDVQNICQNVENIFAKLKSQDITLNNEVMDVLNIAMDTVDDLISNKEPKNDILDIINLLEKAKFEKSDLKENELEESEAEKKQKEQETETEKKIIEKKVSYEKDLDKSDTKKKKLDKKHTAQRIQYKEISKESGIPVGGNDGNNTIRVAKSKLDSLMLQGEQLLYVKISAEQRFQDINELKQLWEAYDKSKEIEDKKLFENKLKKMIMHSENRKDAIGSMLESFMRDIKDIMLSPFSIITAGLPKLVRDISKEQGKSINITIEGDDTEVDRRILEELKDPLLHIIRNSVDHGIETCFDREKSNKDRQGKIKIEISQIASDKIKLIILDDGRGIDITKIRQKAIDNGMKEKEVLAMQDEEIINLIYESGLSTSDEITDISGRGLGLAIVMENLKKLGGGINVRTTINQGTAFEITIPVSLSTHRGILVKSAGQIFVMPTLKVSKVMRIKSEEIKTIETKKMVLVDDSMVPVVRLFDVLELSKITKINLNHKPEYITVLFIHDMQKTIALMVDEVLSEQEVLVKTFNKQLTRVRNISGATILGNGDIVPILNAEDLIKSTLKNLSIYSEAKTKETEQKKEKNKNILVVDDSITSRMLLNNILKSAGYSVKTAVDGSDGWIKIKTGNFALVVSDIEMPNINGFELTAKIRADKETEKLPIILVTSLESREDKERGIDVGANAYIVKNNFEQNNLLETIAKLI